MALLYVKVAALNFGATVFDSDDLSTIRGSSLALLRFPALLESELRTTFEQLSIEPVLTSASETVLRIAAREASEPAERYEPARPAKGMSRNGWVRAVRNAAERLGPSAPTEAVRSAAEALCQSFSQLRDRSKIEMVIQQIDQARAGALSTPGVAVDLASLAPAIEKACLDLTKGTHDGWAFDCFTFAVVSHLDKKNRELRTIFTLLDNRLRLQQQKSLTVPLPDRGPSPLPPATKAVCRVTGVLAAVSSIKSPEPRSDSVNRRRKGGREQRQDFYEEQLRIAARHATALLADLPPAAFRETARTALEKAVVALPACAEMLAFQQLGFAKSFEDIVADPPDHLPPGARSKLAVIYVDGNGFGSQALKRAAAKDAQGYRRYSLYLEARGGLLLDSLLVWMIARPTMRAKGASDDGEVYRLRFETLLWGGDEMLFVLPAWEAADFMTMLQAALGTWSIPEYDKAEGHLTFAAGMVFGHHKTQIRDLRDVAYQLCATVKKQKRPGNWLQTISLEGIDRAEIDPAAIRHALLNASDEHLSCFDIGGARWHELVATARELEASLGQTQLHRRYRQAAAKGLIKAPGGLADDARPELRAMITRLGELGADRTAATRLDGDLFAAGGGAWPFLPLHQLIELWDFLTPEAAVAEEQAA